MKYVAELFSNTTIRGGMLFFLGGITANVFSYLYRIAMGRMLPPAEFGEVTALVSLLLIFAVPASPLQTVGAKIASQFAASRRLAGLRAFFFRMTIMLAATSLLVVALSIALSPFIAQFLQISSPATLFWVWGGTAFLLIASVSRGVLQGLERFSQTAILVTLEGAVKMGTAVLFVAVGWGVAGAMGGFFISAFVAYLLSLIFLHDIFALQSDGATGIRDSHLAREIALTFLAFLFLNLLLNADVLLVKHYFSPEDAGIFSAVATIGRIVFLIGTILSGVMFPLIVRAHEQRRDVFRPLFIVSGISSALTVASASLFGFFPDFFLSFFFGHDYLAAAPYVGYYSILMILMAGLFLGSYFFMALGHFRFLFILAAISVAEIFFIILWHENFLQILGALTLAFTVALAAMALMMYCVRQKFQITSSALSVDI